MLVAAPGSRTSKRSSCGAPESEMPPRADDVTAPGEVPPRFRSVPTRVTFERRRGSQPAWLQMRSSPPRVSRARTRKVRASAHSPV